MRTSCGTALSSTATGSDSGNAPHGADLRIGRTSIIGQTYSITAVTHERHRFFDDHRLARELIRALRSLSEAGVAHTHGFVVMPDHFHWLLTLRGGTLSTLMARAKGSSARQINVLLGRGGSPVWQRGFHDRALRRDEDVHQIARYIVANPLRAGLVRTIGDYPWWDAEWL
jgi:REP element-mobilizing transposase RayT